MNITDNLIRIKEGKENIIKSLKNKGVSIADNTLINEIPTIIDNAEIGGGGDTPVQPEIPELVQKYEGATVFRINVPEDNYDVFLTLGGHRNSSAYNSYFNIDWGDSTDIEELLLADVNCHKYRYKGYYDINVFNLPDKYTSLIGGSEFSSNNSINVNIFDNPFNNKHYTLYDTSSGGRFNGNVSGITVVNDNICISVLLDSPITSIGEYAFQNCSSLTSIVIPNSVTSIGEYAFQDCSSLTSIVIPNSVTSIGNYAFQGCSSLTSIVIPNLVTSIGEYAFQDCSSLTSIVIPNSVTSIGNNAFKNCSSLTSIVIPEGVTKINNSTFENCSSLENINIPLGIKRIENNTFNKCRSLTSIIIPEGVTYLGSYNFSYCTSLLSVSLPSTLTSIGYNNFNGSLYNPNQLQYIISRAKTAPTITSNTFQYSASNGILYIPQDADITTYQSLYWITNLLDKGWTIEYITEL